MTRAHLYATHPHYFDHLAPIWHALAPWARGTAYCGYAQAVHNYVRSLGIEPYAGFPPPTDDLVIVASGNDLPGIRRAVLVEHGVGQSYRGCDHPSWSGGEGRQNVEAFVVPRPAVARANYARYPSARYIVAGSPHLEALWTLPPYAAEHLKVVFTAHWETALVPEMRSAWAYYETAIEKHARSYPTEVVLHAHPKFADTIRPKAEAWGVPYIEHFADVVGEAYLLVADNTSVLYEWAGLGRPVVVLNAPWYRRDVAHGLRFWECADVGLNVDAPEDLESAITLALADPLPIRMRRASIVSWVFSGGIRGAAERAARGIEELLEA